jgi:hypothetical protein
MTIKNYFLVMSCYICLEGGKMIKDKGCVCKGSLNIHASCFQKWIDNTDNPFICPVCKTDYKLSFLSSFMTIEEMLTCGVSDEENESIFYVDHGVPITEINGFIYFDSDEHFSIYQHSSKMEKKSIRLNNRNSSKRYVKPISKHFKHRYLIK